MRYLVLIPLLVSIHQVSAAAASEPAPASPAAKASGESFYGTWGLPDVKLPDGSVVTLRLTLEPGILAADCRINRPGTGVKSEVWELQTTAEGVIVKEGRVNLSFVIDRGALEVGGGQMLDLFDLDAQLKAALVKQLPGQDKWQRMKFESLAPSHGPAARAVDRSSSAELKLSPQSPSTEWLPESVNNSDGTRETIQRRLSDGSVKLGDGTILTRSEYEKHKEQQKNFSDALAARHSNANQTPVTQVHPSVAEERDRPIAEDQNPNDNSGAISAIVAPIALVIALLLIIGLWKMHGSTLR